MRRNVYLVVVDSNRSLSATDMRDVIDNAIDDRYGRDFNSMLDVEFGYPGSTKVMLVPEGFHIDVKTQQITNLPDGKFKTESIRIDYEVGE